MTDYSSEFFFDPGITIKEEPMADSMSTSASVPIPARRALELDDFQRFGFDLENSQSPLSTTSYTMMDQLQNQEGLESNGDMWSGRSDSGLKSEVFIHMDDDDIFQVDKADLIQGPTLAELNANDDTLLGEINFDDFLLPEENTYTTLAQKPINVLNTNTNNNNNPLLLASSCPQRGLMFYREQEPVSFESFTARTPTSVSAFSPTSQTSSSSSLLPSSPLHHTALQQKHSTLHELLMKRENYTSASPDRHLNHTPTQSATPPNAFLARAFYSTDQVSRLSSSAPTHSGPPDHIWQRREPRQHLLSTGSLVEAGSTSSLSTGGILSPDPQDLSNDEFDSDEDSDAHYEDFSSDDSDDDDDHKKSSKKERFFWQYNVQAKGPKGQRLVMKCKMEDPHVLNEVTDPVFSTDCSVRGIKHSGKARKGDGNDLTPNPRKLFTIGKELHKLSRTINDMTPVSELPFNVRPKSRKEKNKLASRACRLKKKAQHEANKIKLSGLEAEHKRLINGISQVKHVLIAKINDSVQEKEDTGAHLDKLAKSTTKIRIAGHTTEYVNKVLDKIKGNGQAVTMDDL